MAQVCGTSLTLLMEHLSPKEVWPNLLEEAGEWLKALPMVSDWVRRSAFRRGAVTALSLGLAHFPEDFDPADVTSGYPSVPGGVTEQHVQSLYKWAAPYAQRVLDMGDLLPHQHTVDPPEDGPARMRDYHSSHPFKSAIKNRLTSYPVESGEVRLGGSPVEVFDGSVKSPEESG